MFDNLEELKRRVADLRQRKDQAEGAAKSVRARLKKEFGVETPKQAKRLLRQLEEEERSVAREYAAAKKKLEEDYEDELAG